MKILHVIPWLAQRYGGPATLVPQACAALAARGHDVEIITTIADREGSLHVPTGRVIEWSGAQSTFHPLTFPTRYLTSWSMLAELRHRMSEFDLVHIHGLYRFPDLAAASVARLRRVPYVIQAHGSLDPWHRRQKERAKDLYHAVVQDPIIRGAEAMVCTSAHEQRSILRLGYAIPTRVIPIGVDAGQLRTPGLGSAAGPDYLPVDSRVVTFLGRITAKKGVPLLVESFRSVVAAMPNTHLVVAGPDDEGIAMELLPSIARAGLMDRISFPGVLGGPEKRALLQRSDVFVLPSADESFGIAVAEAMAVGVPVVISRDVAIEDVVRTERAGLVVDRDPVALAKAIVAILRDPVSATAMGEAGRRLVDERFSWSSVAAETEALYISVLAARGRHPFLHPGPEGKSLAGPASSDPRQAVCPRCRSPLQHLDAARTWHCSACGWDGLESDGIPILLMNPESAEHDELDHDHGHGHKAAQAAHFDRPGRETFEIERPHGSPRLYRYLLGQKSKRAIGPIRPHLIGASALVVCGGSGMDAEALACSGAAVTTSDLSLGAATRAISRSKRFKLDLQSIVADVEHLPFADQSFDLVSVHDGLHHLNDPKVGLAEMARVARRWVVVTEPARASITRLAARLGMARDVEDAGNRVARLDPGEVASFLQARGFVVLRAGRYAMYYPHHPGAAFRILSLPGVFPVVRMAWRVANAVIGRLGNKMVVVAERRQ